MIQRDYRTNEVVWRMPFSEFRDHVEWLEAIARDDGATRDLRAVLDRIDPPDVSAHEGEPDGRLGESARV